MLKFEFGRNLRLLVSLAAIGVAPAPGMAHELGSSLYIREDTDGTTVISPRLRVAGQATESTRLDASYTVDVWSSASIDIRTAATPRIYEQRDEVDLGASQLLDDLTLGGTYRYSKENDYESHGGSLSLSLDLADKATTLASAFSVSLDDVGRAGDPAFSRDLHTFGGRLGLTQVLDPETLLQLNYDLSYLRGFQSSAYRRVLSAPTVTCEDQFGCREEAVPDERLRHAIALQARRSFGSSVSMGLGYRYYFDDWALSSHTVEAKLSFLPARETTLSLRYRFYVQGGADFFKPYYTDLTFTDTGGYRTHDRELSPLMSHRIGLDSEQEFEFGRMLLRGSIFAGLTHYDYDNFPGLTTVQAYEFTVALSTEL